jgi:hypothetical protein
MQRGASTCKSATRPRRLPWRSRSLPGVERGAASLHMSLAASPRLTTSASAPAQQSANSPSWTASVAPFLPSEHGAGVTLSQLATRVPVLQHQGRREHRMAVTSAGRQVRLGARNIHQAWWWRHKRDHSTAPRRARSRRFMGTGVPIEHAGPHMGTLACGPSGADLTDFCGLQEPDSASTRSHVNPTSLLLIGG